MPAERIPVKRANAWLLDFGQSFCAAVGTRVLLQITDNPRLHPVPCTPQHCNTVFSWQGRLLPVVDMASILGAEPQAPHLLAIAGYREQPGEPTRFGALLLAAPPVAIAVGDDQSCMLPEQAEDWGKFAFSCCEQQDKAIPILHLARVFSSLNA
jgi:chemotaxis signal transduction protein